MRGLRRNPDREERVLGIIETARAKRPKFRDERITMAHGAGGKATGSLIEGLLVPAFASPALDALGDAGVIAVGGTGLALTTDAFVVTPLRFPGGSIGELAVNGTVNDLAMAGARPLALSLSLILEEGLEAEVLRAEVEAIARPPRRPACAIVTGDTKVVERGHADEMYITTTGVGRVDPRAALSPAALRPGDRILLSGPIGEHGTAIMLARGEFELGADIASDTRSLWPAVDALLDAAGPGLRCLRDATRGGVASVLNELARASGVAMLVHEQAVPVDAGRRRRRGAARASTRCTSPTRASSWRSSPRSTRTRRSPRCGRPRAARRPPTIGEVRTEPPGHGARGDRVRRQAGDGPARRRPAAEDLLMHELSIADAIVRHRRAPRARAPGGDGRGDASGTCARSCPSALEFAFGLVAEGTAARGRGAGDGGGAGRRAGAARCGAETVFDGFPLACARLRRAGPGAAAPARSCWWTRWSSKRR